MKRVAGLLTLFTGIAGTGCAGMDSSSFADREGPVPVLSGGTLVRGPTGTWEGRNFRGVVQQQFDYSCGAASLMTLMRHSFDINPLPEERDLVERMVDRLYAGGEERPENAGFSLLDLKTVASWYGLQAVGVRLPLETMLDLRAPAIVHLQLWGELEHFAIWQGAANGRVKLADPSRGYLDIPLWQFALEWSGHVLLVARPGSGPPERTLAEIAEGTRDRPENLVTWMNSLRIPPPAPMRIRR